MPATAIPLRASVTSIRVLGRLRVLYISFKSILIATYFFKSTRGRTSDIQAFRCRSGRKAAPVNRIPYIRHQTSYIRHRFDARIFTFHEVEGDGAVGSLQDVGDGFTHELAAVGSRCEERGCGRRLVRQAVVDGERRGVGIRIGRGAEVATAQPIVLGPSGKILPIILRTPGAEVLARGVEQTVAIMLVGGIHQASLSKSTWKMRSPLPGHP